MTDPLTDALRSVRLAGGIFVGASFTAPWSVTSCASIENLRHFGVRTTGVIAYHYVVEGALLLGFEGDDMIEVKAGEIFDFTDTGNAAANQLFSEVVGSLAAAFSIYTNDSVIFEELG